MMVNVGTPRRNLQYNPNCPEVSRGVSAAQGFSGQLYPAKTLSLGISPASAGAGCLRQDVAKPPHLAGVRRECSQA
jgi:hypothetical protein